MGRYGWLPGLTGVLVTVSSPAGVSLSRTTVGRSPAGRPDTLRSPAGRSDTTGPVAGSVTAASSSAAGVVPFQQGVATTSKQIGQIPSSYTQGSGTIVSGSTANKATEAALAAYPGGIVDRVVQLSNGDFEVHYIGVNWPHHIFVNQGFDVIGAN